MNVRAGDAIQINSGGGWRKVFATTDRKIYIRTATGRHVRSVPPARITAHRPKGD